MKPRPLMIVFALAAAAALVAPVSNRCCVAQVSNLGNAASDGVAPANSRQPEDIASRIRAGDLRADFNGDGVTDGRDIQAYVTRCATVAALKAHPDYPAVHAELANYLKRTPERLAESPEAILRTVEACALLEYLTGEWPRPSETRPILRRLRDEWPLPFANFNHQVTLWYIPTMVRAATLSPTARPELTGALRWCEARMLEPQMPFKPPTAMYSTSPGSGLRSMVMIREALYGEDSAREAALRGFGTDPTQWGLSRLIDECIDEHGLLRVNVAAFNHWAWTNRPALVWLLETRGYKRHLNREQRAKWRKFYNLPCRMLCVGGKTFTIPNVNDDYSMNPVLGPVNAWTGDTKKDRWARWHARRQGVPTFDWLLVPGDPEGYAPPERPPGCSGDRDFGRLKLSEDDAGTVTRIEYRGDGERIIMGGHRAGRAIQVEVRR